MTDENAYEHILTLLWEYVYDYVENSDFAKKRLHEIIYEVSYCNPACAEPVVSLDIQVSDEFKITECTITDNGTIIEFEMVFIAIVNYNKETDDKFYHIQGAAVGKLTVPTADSFDYENYNFDEMIKTRKSTVLLCCLVEYQIGTQCHKKRFSSCMGRTDCKGCRICKQDDK